MNTLWSIRTEALMLEEYSSTVTVSSLAGEVKDVLIDEVVRFSGEDNSDEVENARENCGGFHNKILSGLCFRVVSHHQVRSNQLRTTPFPGFRD